MKKQSFKQSASYIETIKKSSYYYNEREKARKNTREYIGACFEVLGLGLLLLFIFILF
jgi:hypothetical protein